MPVPSASSDPAPFASAASRRARPPRKFVAGVAAVAVLIGLLVYLAIHNDSVAGKYHHLDTALAAKVRQADVQVTNDNRDVRLLEGQESSLRSQLTSTQSDLSSVANQKAKQLDLLKGSGQVGAELNSCINDIIKFANDVNSAINTGSPSAQTLQAEGNQLNVTCGAAQGDYKQLQTQIQQQS